MLFLIIFGSIVLIIAFIMMLSISVTVIFEDSIDLKIKVWFIKIFSIDDENFLTEKEKKKIEKKKEKAKIKQKKKEEKQEKKNPKRIKQNKSEKSSPKSDIKINEKPQKSDTTEKTENLEKKEISEETDKKSKINPQMIIDLITSAAPPIKRLFKKIRYRDVYIECIAGGEDAAKVAINYGIYCSLIYSLVKVFDENFRCSFKEVNIRADFEKEKTEFFVHAKVKVKIGTILVTLLWFVIKYLRKER